MYHRRSIRVREDAQVIVLNWQQVVVVVAVAVLSHDVVIINRLDL